MNDFSFVLYNVFRRESNKKKVLSEFPFCVIPGGPMDHAGPIPMVNEFGGMTPDAQFLNQPNGPPGGAGNGPDHILGTNGPRGGSPEFIGSNQFSEPQNMQNEGLVW